MTDLEISKALALAIGWQPQFMMAAEGKLRCYRGEHQWGWQVFDYRDWNVISPIAEKYECFPMRTKTEEWFANIFDCNGFYADTPQKAIALAVIGSGV